VVANDPVLLVEDNADTREALARLLVLRGYAVVATCDGEEAWDYFQRGGRACAIILDLYLPRLDGGAFRRRLLTRTELARIPVLVFSVAAEQTVPRVAAFVRKGEPDALLDLVDSATAQTD
jgi:CheY-like chemotaxis protein